MVLEAGSEFQTEESGRKIDTWRNADDSDTLYVFTQDYTRSSFNLFELPKGTILRYVDVEGQEMVNNLGGVPITKARWIHHREPEVKKRNREMCGRLVASITLDLIPGRIGMAIKFGEAALGQNAFGERLTPRQRIETVTKALIPTPVAIAYDIFKIVGNST